MLSQFLGGYSYLFRRVFLPFQEGILFLLGVWRCWKVLYRLPYKRTSWGEFLIEAESLEEAKKKMEIGDIMDELDNKSEYEWDLEEIEEVEEE